MKRMRLILGLETASEKFRRQAQCYLPAQGKFSRQSTDLHACISTYPDPHTKHVIKT